jgi:hypothetical protein
MMLIRANIVGAFLMRSCRSKGREPHSAELGLPQGTANTAMSNGDMRSACKSFIRAQKKGSIKS